MRLNKDCSFSAFLQAVDACAGAVTFETPEGDVLNLKSQLSKFIFLAAVSSESLCALTDGQVLCTAAADYALLEAYLCD